MPPDLPPPPGCRVELLRFNGQPVPPPDCRPDENYWLLIGRRGQVVEAANAAGRVLVRFEESVAALGLQCHNPLPNTLLILASDLRALDAA